MESLGYASDMMAVLVKVVEGSAEEGGGSVAEGPRRAGRSFDRPDLTSERRTACAGRPEAK